MADIVAIGEPLVEFAAVEPADDTSPELFVRGFGGDTSNFAIACARLGGSVGYLTSVGDDEFGRSLLSLWERNGVEVERVQVEADGFTGFYFVTYDADRKHEFTYYRAGSAAARMHPGTVDWDSLAGVGVVHVSGISQAISSSAAELVDAAFSVARANGAEVSYDANLRPRLAAIDRLRSTFEATVEKTDLLFLSDEDVGHIYPDRDSDDLLDELAAAGPRVVVLRLGADGCRIAAREGDRFHSPGFAVDAVDATGAGDAFTGAFVTELRHGADLRAAARMANAVGALTVTGTGAVAPVPNRARLERFLAADD